tara:strand:- start:16056 stop:16583 length:528 start_codon:yes stop_codon:yes gene_type:complete
MVFRPIIGTLVYLLDRESNSVLLIKRDTRPTDDHYGKFNGLGGKLELDESVVAGACREFEEESGATLKQLSLRGTITWSNFGPKKEEWLGFIFLAESWEGEIAESNEEGSLIWVGLERILKACDDDEETRTEAKLPMWAGDRYFLPMVFDEDQRQFHGTMPYDGDTPIGWNYSRT